MSVKVNQSNKTSNGICEGNYVSWFPCQLNFFSLLENMFLFRKAISVGNSSLGFDGDVPGKKTLRPGGCVVEQKGRQEPPLHLVCLCEIQATLSKMSKDPDDLIRMN